MRILKFILLISLVVLMYDCIGYFNCVDGSRFEFSLGFDF